MHGSTQQTDHETSLEERLEKRFEYLEQKMDGLFIILSEIYKQQAIPLTRKTLNADAIKQYPIGSFERELFRRSRRTIIRLYKQPESQYNVRKTICFRLGF